MTKAYRFLITSDRKRFGGDIDSMAKQNSVGTKQYPKTFADAHKMLLKFEEFYEKHPRDKEKTSDNKKKDDKNKKAR
jgi:hypothetical protein